MSQNRALAKREKGAAERRSSAIVDASSGASGALSGAYQLALFTWAESCTDKTSPRFKDLIRDKCRVITGFFVDYMQHGDRWRFAEITALDIKSWQAEMEHRGLSPSSVYGNISRLSSFYNWLLAHPEMREGLRLSHNPVSIARPKAPKAYQSESTSALSDADVKKLLAHVLERARRGDLVGKRDFALLTFYFLTGMRRSEVIRLRWGDLKFESRGIIMTTRVKGGKRINVEIRRGAPVIEAALKDYLEASERLASMKPDTPIWVAHDPVTGKTGNALSSHGFVKNFKKYAVQAGLGDIHLHQTRHTAAREVGDRLGLKAAQEMLGHSSEQTTRIYVQRIGIRRDNFSGLLAEAFGLDGIEDPFIDDEDSDFQSDDDEGYGE